MQHAERWWKEAAWACSPCSDLSQELALFLSDPGLVPDRQFQQPFLELSLMDRGVHEGLVPPRFHRLLHRLGSPLALIARKGKRQKQMFTSEPGGTELAAEGPERCISAQLLEFGPPYLLSGRK